jgi:hypothetical protein
MRQVVGGDEHHRLPEARHFLGEGKGGHGSEGLGPDVFFDDQKFRPVIFEA